VILFTKNGEITAVMPLGLYPFGITAEAVEKVYDYDDRGNITAMHDYSYTTGTTLTSGNTYNYEYDDNTWADLLTEYDGADIAYDALGNPTNWIWGETLTWQNGRQLAGVNGYTDMTYTYNADGLRTSKSGDRNTEYFIVDGEYIGEITTINGTEYVISYVYDESGSPAGINVNGGAYFFVKNLQGDVTAIVSYNGTVICKYYYDAYGYPIYVKDANGANITSENHIALLNPFRYRGYMYDEETCFYYLRTRYYDPYIGRFLNADGYVSTGTGLGGYNMFAYCNGNPVMYIDIYGNCPGTFEHIRRYFAKLETCEISHNGKDAYFARYKEQNSKVMPVPGAVINYNDYPYYEFGGPHRGTDIDGDTGDPVYSATSGTVVRVDTTIYYNTLGYDEINKKGYNSYGIHVMVNYGDYTIIYAHLSGVAVTVGQEVYPWDLIGYVGNTGNSEGDHLHFEVKDDYNNPVSPYPFLP